VWPAWTGDDLVRQHAAYISVDSVTVYWCSADIFRSVAFRCQDRRSRLFSVKIDDSVGLGNDFSLISVAAETVSLFRTATACQQDPTDIKVTVFVNVLQMYVKRVGELTLVNFLAKIWT